MSGRRPLLGGAVRGERVRLRDGSVVLIRLVQSGDAPLLADGFARLSSESRELRFLRGKANLTPAELRYLTAIDHHNHEAVGALNPVDGRGLGVARYIRDAKDPEGAEVAVTVIDDWQRRGLGIELLKRLVDRARQEGIRHFTALVSDDNAGVAALLQGNRIGVRVIHGESGAVEYQITLPPRGLGDELHALLRALGGRQLKAPAPIRDTLAVLTPRRSAGYPRAPPGTGTPPVPSQSHAADLNPPLGSPVFRTLGRVRQILAPVTSTLRDDAPAGRRG